MLRLPRLLGLALLVLSSAVLAAAPAAEPLPFPRAELEQRPVATVLLFHPRPPTKKPAAEAKALLAREFKGWKQAASSEALGEIKAAAVLVQALPPEAIDPITEEQLGYFARGFDAEQAKQLMGAKQATLLVFSMPRAKRFELLKEATHLSQALAERLGAFLWDGDTRQYFTPAAWKKQRLDPWKAQVPFLADHITYHLYPTDEGLRAISLGMAKFGLPDVVVEQLPRALGSPMGHLLNASVQLLAEGSGPDASGTFVVSLDRVKEARAREQLLGDVGAGAKRRTTLRAVQARRDEGDPDNALMELTFPGEGALEVRQMARVSELLGAQPQQIIGAKSDDAELAEVAKKARRRLEELRPTFARGLGASARLSLKAGFPTDDGSTEWMWFELRGWQGNSLRGTLLNEPRDVSTLKLGSPVEVRLDQVADYLYRPGDGTEEGGESGRILMRRQGE